MGERLGLRRGLMMMFVVGDTDGEGDRDGDRRCFRGVNGDPSGNMYVGAGGSEGSGGYDDIGSE